MGQDWLGFSILGLGVYCIFWALGFTVQGLGFRFLGLGSRSRV